MGRIVVMTHVTLDGVMQAPGRPEEDTRGAFDYGGWARRAQGPDDDMGTAMGERMAAGGGLAGWLFGRRTSRSAGNADRWEPTARKRNSTDEPALVAMLVGTLTIGASLCCVPAVGWRETAI